MVELAAKIKDWKDEKIQDHEMALFYFLYLYQQKFPHKYLTDYLSKNTFDQNILEFIQFKKIKEKALICLKMWVSGKWNLKLVDRILRSEEVLTLQSQGIRPVTMLASCFNSPVLHRKDALDFFCHDLEHGYMFFHDDNLKKMQVSFFCKIQSSLETDLWKNYLKNPIFKEKFQYLISDMNSHQEHYKAYLNAMIPKGEFHKFEFLFS